MATFNWTQGIDHGSCLICGTWTNDRGFVDFVGETVVRNAANDEVAGVIDVTVCGTCLEQAARLVGCATPQETTEWAYKEQEYLQSIEKLKGEVAAWQQRLMGLANLSLKDFEALSVIEEVGATEVIDKVKPAKAEEDPLPLKVESVPK